MKPIIRVENLGKRYRIGQRAAPYATIRESLVGAARAPFDRLRRSFRREVNGDAASDRFWALKDVSFEVKPGEVVGIIGRNGAGKSTLLKILSRVTEPTEGRVDLYGRVGSLLEVGTGFHPELSGRENVYLNGAILGMKRREIDREFDSILKFAEIERFLDTPVKRYSSGMFVRLAFAVAAHLQTEILAVDEVLAVGDTEFQKKCLGKMGEVSSESGRTVLFVSHNIAAVNRLCGRCILLNHGSVAHSGPTREVLARYKGETAEGRIMFEQGALRDLSVCQDGDELKITTSYEVDRPLNLACFGFVISDHSGQPICGSNPRIEGLNLFGRGKNSGRIVVRMRQPKLRDGPYFISVWMGEGSTNFFAAENCLRFDVAGMSGSEHIDPSITGPVAPKCEWILGA